MQGVVSDLDQWCISHASALEYWRKTAAGSVPVGKPCAVDRLTATPSDARRIRVKTPFGLSSPLHVSVGDQKARKTTRKLVCRISERHFPQGSFFSLSRDFIISCPELCFVQMANLLSLIELIKLGFELCGGYRLSHDVDGNGFRTAPPLTDHAKLTAYVMAVAGLKGCEKARRALQYIADGAASPMETVVTMLLSLPYRMGGYGFSLSSLNHPIRVGGGNGICPVDYRADLFWPEVKVDIEYDSDSFHTGSRRIAKDAIRRNKLSSVGVTVLTVSRMQVGSAVGFHEVALVLAGILRKRIAPPLPGFYKARAALRRQLLPGTAG